MSIPQDVGPAWTLLSTRSDNFVRQAGVEQQLQDVTTCLEAFRVALRLCAAKPRSKKRILKVAPVSEGLATAVAAHAGNGGNKEQLGLMDQISFAAYGLEYVPPEDVPAALVELEEMIDDLLASLTLKETAPQQDASSGDCPPPPPPQLPRAWGSGRKSMPELRSRRSWSIMICKQASLTSTTRCTFCHIIVEVAGETFRRELNMQHTLFLPICNCWLQAPVHHCVRHAWHAASLPSPLLQLCFQETCLETSQQRLLLLLPDNVLNGIRH